MDLRDQLNALTPRLRRYARALATGSPAPSSFADELVHAALMRTLHGRSSKGDLVLQIYATLTQLHREAAAVGQPMAAGGEAQPRPGPTLVPAAGVSANPARQNRMTAGLLGLPLEGREALLLVALEGFDHADAARVLRVPRGVLLARLSQARTALDAILRTRPAAKPQPPAKSPSRDVPYLRVVS